MRAAWIATAALLAGAAPAAAETCHGEKVTISFSDQGVGTKITGTARADVILGGPQDEAINGLGGDDVICGGDGHDKIDGGPGRDELDGQGDSDRFAGPDLGEDVVTGGVGNLDIADYSASPVGITLSMERGLVRAAGAPRNGGILGVERVVGSAQDDRLVGNGKVNGLEGEAGNDVIDGRGGNDQLEGGGGVDTVSYATADARIRLSVEGRDVLVGPGEAHRDEIEGFEVYFGSKHDDRMVGSQDSERFIGGAGDDTLKGFEDGDTLEGGPGDDTIFPGEGDDLVEGGTNDPVRGTGAPGDLVSYEEDTPHGLSGSFDFEAYLEPDPHFHTPPEAIGVGEDQLVGIESIRAPKKGMSDLEGDDGPNVLIGSSRIDVLIGKGGNDLLFGLGSDDSLDGGAGDDYLNGGEPHTDGDTDKLDGGDGDDTCLGAREEYRSGCETTGR